MSEKPERVATMMHNVKMAVNNGQLTITIDLVKGEREALASSTGKSILLASTGGSVPLAGYDGVKLGLNVFKGIPQAAGPATIAR